MAIELTLSFSGDQQIVASHKDTVLATTPHSSLSRITAESNPYRYAPQDLGLKLFQALGGNSLLALLDAAPEATLHLICDEQSATLPWEYACTADGTFLVCLYGFVRLLPQAKRVMPAKAATLQFVALAADPLVDEQGNPRTGYKLQIEDELRAIDLRLRESEVALRARRVPPLRKELQSALSKGPALLHLSCHGNVVETAQGKLAVLFLEDENGKADPVRSDHLLRLWPPGVLRLALFSACRTAASALDADLARALVLSGAPAAIGMQGDFPDPLSDELAATFYHFLLAGHPPSEALRMARYALVEHAYAVGLPVCYLAPGGDEPLPLQAGPIQGDGLRLDGGVHLPPLLSQPQLLGRERELHELARTFQQHKVVTVVGTGGIGKSALSGAFARRFGWRWPGGVLGVTLADQPTLNPERIFNDLVRQSLGENAALALADKSAETIFAAWVEANQNRPPLLLFDNYESVLDLLPERRTANNGEARPTEDADSSDATTLANAQRLHRLVNQLAGRGFALLLTSRQQPAGLSGEVVFPAPNRPLDGVTLAAGAQLFLANSSRAAADPRAFQQLAEAIARVTEGHPLAISLLAGEFDNSRARSGEEFLRDWETELAAAQRSGLAAHHVTFAVAFERSWRQLTTRQQRQLALLAQFRLPFFAEGAQLLWTTATAEEEADGSSETTLTQVRSQLEEFVQRSLLRIDDTFAESDLAATYRLEPVISRTLQRYLVQPNAAGYAAYANWLVDRVYDAFGSDPVLAQLTLRWLDELVAQAANQPAERTAWYGWKLAFLARQFGRMQEGQQLLQLAEAAAQHTADEPIRGRILHERANLSVTRGELEQALGLYQESLAIKEKLGDIQGRSATLHAMAYIYRTRGELEQALGLYQESLAIKEKLGDIQGRSATLHEMAYVYVTRGELEQALGLYQESLAIKEKLGDIQGRSATLHAMAYIYRTRGELEQALGLYQESLAIQEKLGDIQGRSATLHAMAYIYRTRGELEQALGLYQESLAIQEKLGDIQGRSATLHQMAYVYVTRGELEQALGLYQESLAIKEKLGDIQGRSATLHAMANVYVTRGELEQALGLYQESLAIKEKLGDIQGRSATLHEMANVYVTRGELEQALGLYQESLAIQEKLGDIKGRGATLHQLGNIFLSKQEWDEAESLFSEALTIAKKLNSPSDVAFEIVSLGQVGQARGDITVARQRYLEGLAIFERLGMPQAQQVRTMLAGLEGTHNQRSPLELLLALTQAAAQGQATSTQWSVAAQQLATADLPSAAPAYLTALTHFLAQSDPATGSALHERAEALLITLTQSAPQAVLPLLFSLARLFDRQGFVQSALYFQSHAIDRLRAAGAEQAAQQTLSVALYNQANYLANDERLDEAVAALEAVVAIDQRWGLADLTDDQQALAAMRRRRDGGGPERATDSTDPAQMQQMLAAMQAQIEQLAPAEQEQARQTLQTLAQASPEELQALLLAQQRQQIEANADQVVDAVRNALQTNTLAALAPRLQAAARTFAEDEPADSPFAQLARFTTAVVALLENQPLPAVPAQYAARLATVQQLLRQS